jgi:hypothetical protein
VSKRRLRIAGMTYEACREARVKDGGSPGTSSAPWYAVVIDGEGCHIDDRVPEGGFKRMRDCHEAIRSHHNWRAAEKHGFSELGPIVRIGEVHKSPAGPVLCFTIKSGRIDVVPAPGGQWQVTHDGQGPEAWQPGAQFSFLQWAKDMATRVFVSTVECKVLLDSLLTSQDRSGFVGFKQSNGEPVAPVWQDGSKVR